MTTAPIRILLAWRDELRDHQGVLQAVEPVSGFVRQDAEFIAAIREGRVAEAGFASCLPSLRLMDRLDRQMGLSAR